MKRRILMLVVFIFGVWGLIFPISLHFSRYAIGEPTLSFYNIFNVLVSALAFAGLITTLILQIEQTRKNNADSVERSVFELFNTFTSDSFQKVKDDAFLCLLVAVKHKPYAKFLASRLLPIGRKSFPLTVRGIYEELRPELITKTDAEIKDIDRAARLHLDNVINFFSMLAQREAAYSVIVHVNFSYDWWRPTLWLIAQLQYEQSLLAPDVNNFCRAPLLCETLKKLDQIYNYEVIDLGPTVYAYLRKHPWLIEEKLDGVW